MKVLALVLAIFLIAIQAQLWMGRGSIAHVAHLREEVAAAKADNEQARARNAQLQAELRDLREGLEMVEEKARFELGMIKSDEVFVPLAANAGTTRLSAPAQTPASATQR
ncbi:cell division protein FtsB [Pelomonas sp. HMWF004]|nr:cell division protein FtsB [Pelomonas sp. HMWF004]